MKSVSDWFTQERLNGTAVFLLLLVCFTYVFPRWADPNQNSRLDLVVAVVEDGTFQIDKYVSNTVDYAKVGDHYYSDKAPGVAILGIPLYAGLKGILDLPVVDPVMRGLGENAAFQATLRADGSGILEQKVRFAAAQIVLTFFLSAVPSALLGVLIYRLLRRFTKNPGPRLAAALAYGLLTPAFAYAGAFYGHQLSAALLFGAFYLIFVREGRLGTRRLLWLGVFLAYSVVTEYPAAMVAGVLFLYALYELYQDGRLPTITWTVLSGGIIALAWMAYNTLIFGGPLELGYSYSELWVDQHGSGFMSLTLPHWDAIWGITFGGFRGLFFYSPILLLGLAGFWVWWRSGLHRAAFWVSAASVILVFLFNASSVMWWGGFAVGPRYLLPALPFLAVPMGIAFERWGSRVGFRLAAAGLAAWSFLAIWGLTLAEQAFPSDSLRNPLLEYALPHWQAGNIARNLGTLLGFEGGWSLAPLGLLIMGIGLLWGAVIYRLSYHRFVGESALPQGRWGDEC